MSHPALFLDRDGVINREVGYLHRPEDVVWVEGIFSLARTAIALGYKLVVVTNQSGIARGFYTPAEFAALTEWIHTEFAAREVPLAATYHCPWHPDGIDPFRGEHEDRKPSPGMLLRGARDLHLDLAQSVLIGDRCSDIAAANAAGLRQAFLIAGTEASSCPGAYIAIDSLAEVERWLTQPHA